MIITSFPSSLHMYSLLLLLSQIHGLCSLNCCINAGAPLSWLLAVDSRLNDHTSSLSSLHDSYSSGSFGKHFQVFSLSLAALLDDFATCFCSELWQWLWMQQISLFFKLGCQSYWEWRMIHQTGKRSMAFVAEIASFLDTGLEGLWLSASNFP